MEVWVRRVLFSGYLFNLFTHQLGIFFLLIRWVILFLKTTSMPPPPGYQMVRPLVLGDSENTVHTSSEMTTVLLTFCSIEKYS